MGYVRRLFWLLAGALVVVVAGSPSVASAQPKRDLVPRVHGMDVTAAYRQLHNAAFRVSIPFGFALTWLPGPYVVFPEVVVRTQPKAGRLVREGSAVKVFLHCECRPGRTVEPRHKPAYRVPDFRGRFVGAAFQWFRPKILVFEARFGPLRAGDTGTLLANYLIDGQSPSPGTMLRYSNRDGGWTPLTVSAKQGSATAGRANANTDPVNALVEGNISDCGGPGPGHCYPRDVVSAFNSQHRLVAKESVTNAHFSFLLLPGCYTIRVRTSMGGRARRSVRAKANKTVHANFRFAIH